MSSSSAMAALVAALLLAALSGGSTQARQEPKPSPATPPAPPRVAFAIENGQLVVKDPTTAYEYIAAALDPTFMSSKPSAEGVLVAVLAGQFPDMTWPPERGTAAAVQWKEMVRRVDAALARRPPPISGLRIVR